MAAATDDELLTLMGLLHETHSGLGRHLNPQLESSGLPRAEFEVLLRLARTPGEQLRMTDLAHQVGLSTSGLTRLVDRLERQGLAAREACASDRRGSFCVLTPEGRKLLDRTLAGHLDLLDRWLAGPLTASEVKTLTGLLRKLRDAVNPEATRGVGKEPSR